MAKAKSAPAAADKTDSTALLDNVLSQVGAVVPGEMIKVDTFTDRQTVDEKPRGEIVTAALYAFTSAIAQRKESVDRLDKELIDNMISAIDQKVGLQLNEILHHPKFQAMESAWRGLKFLVDRTDFGENVNIEVLDVSKEEMRSSFEDVPEVTQAGLYKHVYQNAYDQPGADPYAAVISNYEFDNSAEDVGLLTEISKVAASAHCPFIGSVGSKFFGKSSMDDWKRIPDLKAWLGTADYVKWRSFRQTEDARYVGLVMPRFMLRLPYGPDTLPVQSFNYTEDVKGPDHDNYLWGNASFAFSNTLIDAFSNDGWCVQIRGPQSGGRIDNLPVHVYDVGRGQEKKIPVEVAIDETLEYTCADLGFIPLSHYSGKDYACFFSANSTQEAQIYEEEDATANSRINSRLPYIFLASRIAHHLKVLQRENIGATKDSQVIEDELNEWIGKLVTKMTNPGPEQVVKYPLRDASVAVEELEDNPGYFRVGLKVVPHFQVEGMDVSLSLVGKI